MRNLSKCKLFLCFRPVVDIDAMLDSDASDKHGAAKKPETEPLFFQQGSTQFSESWIMKHPPKRTLSRVMKAVVFKTILMRRARHKKPYRHDSFGSTKHIYGSQTKAPESPLSSSSSPSHGYSTSSPKQSPQPKNVSKTREKHQEIKHSKTLECYGIYLVLLSLAFTVFWGKLLGIILTSMWLYISCVWNSSSYCSQKRLPSYAKSRKARDRCYYGRSY